MSERQAAEERALHTGAVFFDRSERGKIRFEGSARTAFLDRMLTNRVEGLEPGQGTRAELLDVKGSVLADLRLYISTDHIDADVEPDFTQPVIDRLRMFVLRDDVQLIDTTADMKQVTVAGPNGALELGAPELLDLDLFSHTQITLDGELVIAVRTDWTNEPTFDLFGAHVTDLDLTFDIQRASPQTLEVAMIEAGVARQGRELIEGVLPLEAELYGKAIIEKGCYPGQEIITRILHRGHTNRTLVGLLLDGSHTADDTDLQADGKSVGLLTSQAYSATRDAVVALGVVRREHAEPGMHLSVGGRRATVHTLPLRS